MLTLPPFLPKPNKEKNWGNSMWVEITNREEEKSYLRQSCSVILLWRDIMALESDNWKGKNKETWEMNLEYLNNTRKNITKTN